MPRRDTAVSGRAFAKVAIACAVDLSGLIEAVDEEGDGDISKDEFVENAMKCKFIFNMLKSKRT